MGQKLSEKDKELYARIDEVIHYIWDPIGVAGNAQARDEYYSYLPNVFSLAKKEQYDEIGKYLNELTESHIGVKPNFERSKNAIEAIEDWKLYLDEKFQE